MRIVSLVPAATELMYALKRDGELVGVSRHCDYPVDVRSKRIVGQPYMPDWELIEELRPDLLITAKQEERAGVLGLEQYPFTPHTLRDVYDLFLDLGDRLGSQDARVLVNHIKASLSRMRAPEKRRVLIERAPGEPTPAWVNELARFAGGIPFTTQQDRVLPEEVTEFDPEVIIASRETGYECTATREGALVPLDPLMVRPGPRLPQSVSLLGRAIYPARFTTFGTMREEIDKYYENIELPDPRAQYEN